MKKKFGFMLSLFAVMAALFLMACSGSDGDDSPVDDGKTSEELVTEANDAISDGDYDSAVEKFEKTYERNPSDENKIYYALAEIATISTDKDIADIMRNKLGAANYPATLNALFSKDWLKEYPLYGTRSAIKVEKSETGNYIRVSGTPVDGDVDSYTVTPVTVTPVDGDVDSYTAYAKYVLRDGEWASSWRYSISYLSDVQPDDNGDYLIWKDNYYPDISGTSYEEEAMNVVEGYLYKYSWSDGTVTKSDDGNYVRLTGTETDSHSSDTLYCQFKYSNGDWTDSSVRLTDFSPSNDGDYLVYKSSFVNQYARNQAVATYRYDADWYEKTVLVEVVSLPGLIVPDWAKNGNSLYDDTLFGTAQTYDTWWWLLYANAVVNHESGFNDTVDTLLSVIHKKSESVKAVVDSIGSGTALLDSQFIERLNLTEILGEDSFEVGKVEMNVLVSALESIDALLNFMVSYDLSGNFKYAEISSAPTDEELVDIINNCVTAKTLAVRDESKMAMSKSLFADAFGRLAESYESIRNSEKYPQVVKDTLDEYSLYYDGAKKAKSAIENGSVLYIPESEDAASFPSSADGALFGIDFGKIFTPGYFTKLIERSGDMEKVRLYYIRCEHEWGANDVAESEPVEIDDISAFLDTTASDAGDTELSEVWYDVGILANRKILVDALPGADSSAVDEWRFISLFRVR